MEAFRIMLPCFMTTAELVCISGLYLAIRLNGVIGIFLAGVFFNFAAACFCIFKISLEFAAKVTTISEGFSKIHSRERPLTKLDRCFLASCGKLKLKVGETFTITGDTFPTVSQDIILGNLINLLVMSKRMY